jgi:hypothetical protein
VAGVPSRLPARDVGCYAGYGGGEVSGRPRRRLAQVRVAVWVRRYGLVSAKLAGLPGRGGGICRRRRRFCGRREKTCHAAGSGRAPRRGALE